MTNEQRLYPFFQALARKKQRSEFVIDKTGVKTVELIAPRIEFDPQQPYLKFNGRKTPKKYVEAELAWYDSQSLYVNEIAKHASIWDDVCDNDGKVNSNYGYLVYNEGNFNQYENVLKELSRNRDSRRGLIIYMRPTMHEDYNRNGMGDFVCTISHQFMIRDNALVSVVSARSADAIFGSFNDLVWFSTVHTRLLADLQKVHEGLQCGLMVYVPASLHVYERHFDMLMKIASTNTYDQTYLVEE